jgi:lipid II:glycine glycyltransferase (peptidoglycan interpeptide bridge formation enzyme)
VSNANGLLEWEMIRYAKNGAMDNYDLGGYYTGDLPDNEKANINEFKSSFGGEFVMRHDHHKGYSPLLRGIRSAKNALDMMWNCAHWTRHALPRTHVYEGLNAAILQ